MSARRYQDRSIFQRLFKAMISVVILSAFVLLIALTVKGFATFDPIRFGKIARPILAKLNINEDMAGEVAGQFAKRLSATSINKETDTSGTSPSHAIDTGTNTYNSTTQKEVKYRVSLMSDTEVSTTNENTYENLSNALQKEATAGTDVVLFLGDLTGYGEIDKLREGKEVFDNSGLEYYVIPGDLDLGDSVDNKNDEKGTKNFIAVFDRTNDVVRVGEYKIVMFDNSKNFTPLEQTDIEWLKREIVDTDFLVLSQPLYHESSKKIMGYVEGEEIPEVKAQAEEILNIIRGFDVRAVIAAEQHMFSKSDDPVIDGLVHYTTGALADERNPLGPSYAVMEIYEDGSYNIRKVAL